MMKRGRAYRTSSWNLAEIIVRDYDSKFEEINLLIKDFGGYKSVLNPKMSKIQFRKVVRDFEWIHNELWDLEASIELEYSADTTSKNIIRAQSNFGKFTSDWSNNLLFFNRWIKKLKKRDFERLVSAVPKNEAYFRGLIDGKKYSLSKRVEEIINLKDVGGVEVIRRTYTALTSKFKFPFRINGKLNQLTEVEVENYFAHPDKNLRKRYFKSVAGVYSENAEVLGGLFIGIATDWYNENVKIRRYKTPISVTNYNADVSDKAVDMLFKSCQDNRIIFERYFEMKKYLCDVNEKFRYEDIYAPVKSKNQFKMSYNDAVHLIIGSYEKFSKKMAKIVKDMFDNKHVHSRNSKTKIPQQFCYSLPQTMPFVIVNYNGNLDCVMVLAHEIGHSIHSELSRRNQNVLTFDASISLCETASVFSEMLISENLLKFADSTDLKIKALVRQIDDAYATTVKQAYYSLFEVKAHDMVNSRVGASVEDLSNLYYENLNEQLGGSVFVAEYMKNNWLTVPHFFDNPFYCYSYAFGYLLTQALYSKYEETGDDFVSKFENILKAGGAISPKDGSNLFDFNIERNSFYQKGFDRIDKKINELEKLL